MKKVITCTAPVNIAVIKYWGKRDEKLILPLNSSLSVTLNQNDLRTITSVMASSEFKEDELWLNGEKVDITKGRIQTVLQEVRKRANTDVKVHIVSENNFPTAAGLASSASGYCCLAFALAKLFDISGDISILARIGSGSACRSMYGGFVTWEMGTKEDGSDSKAVQVKPETHWPELQILILVVSDKKKSVGSTVGMQKTVETSKLLQERVKNIVPKRMKEMEKAIIEKDFETFADLTMKDSDNFHACCKDTDPPIIYMNEISHKICNLIHKFNEVGGKKRAAYTYDAGPNAVVYLLKEDLIDFLSLVIHYFPPKTLDTKFFKNEDLLKQVNQHKLNDGVISSFGKETFPESLQYILHTTPGPGPQIISTTSLINESTGQPK